MRYLKSILVALVLASTWSLAAPRITPAPSTGSGGGGTPVDAGYVIWGTNSTGSTNERVITAGANVTLSTATPGQIIINAAAGGSGNLVETSIDTGTGLGTFYSTVVTGQSWVVYGSKIQCGIAGSADGGTHELIAVAHLTISVAAIVPGTGFTVFIYSPHGLAGVVRVICSGV